jgi:hypothetical protein
VRSLDLADEISFDVYARVQARCLQAIANGLSSLRAVSLRDREQFGLFVCIPDDDPAKTVHLIQQLNSNKVYDRYAETLGL